MGGHDKCIKFDNISNMHSWKEDTSVLNHVCYSRSGVCHPGDDFFKAVVLEGGLGTSGGPKKFFQEVHQVKTMCIIIFSCYLHFSLIL